MQVVKFTSRELGSGIGISHNLKLSNRTDDNTGRCTITHGIDEQLSKLTIV